MQNLLLIGAIIEAAVLLGLTIYKKWTKKIFYIISALTILLCLIAVVLGLNGNAKNRDNDQRKYSYMAVKLIEDNYIEKAIEPMTVVVDSKAKELNVNELRGMVYNLNGMYDTANLYLAKMEGDNVAKILEASKARTRIDEELKKDIISKIMDAIDATEDEINRWDAELKLVYIDDEIEKDEDHKFDDKLLEAKVAIKQKDYEKAYDVMTNDKGNTSLGDDIVISSMYIRNYNSRTMADYDIEYSAIWEEVAEAQADMNEKSLALLVDEVKPEDQEAYDRAYAEYQVANSQLNREAIKRSINYMLAIKENVDDNIAYKVQMSYLYYLNNEEDEALKYLEDIFAVEEMPNKEWMEFDTYLFREAYLDYLSDATNTEYHRVFSQMMNSLYQNVFSDGDYYYSAYERFVTNYLDTLFNGFVIQNVNIGNYPNVIAQVSCLDEEFELTKDNIKVIDTDEEITDFELSKVEVGQLSICYVLDKSGSMSGDSMRDAKDAIRENVMSMDTNNMVGLVAFDNEADIECHLTNSVYMAVGKLDAINAEGGTCITAGLEKSKEVLKDASGRKVVILLSDGYDGNNSNLEQVLQELRMNNIVVYAIGLKGCDESYLQHIADVTGGDFMPASESSQLAKIYQNIQKSLVSVYQISYEVQGDNVDRYVKVKMKDSLAQGRRKYSTVVTEVENEYIYENGEQQSDYFKQNGGSKGAY